MEWAIGIGVVVWLLLSNSGATPTLQKKTSPVKVTSTHISSNGSDIDGGPPGSSVPDYSTGATGGNGHEGRPPGAPTDAQILPEPDDMPPGGNDSDSDTVLPPGFVYAPDGTIVTLSVSSPPQLLTDDLPAGSTMVNGQIFLPNGSLYYPVSAFGDTSLVPSLSVDDLPPGTNYNGDGTVSLPKATLVDDDTPPASNPVPPGYDSWADYFAASSGEIAANEANNQAAAAAAGDGVSVAGIGTGGLVTGGDDDTPPASNPGTDNFPEPDDTTITASNGDDDEPPSNSDQTYSVTEYGYTSVYDSAGNLLYVTSSGSEAY